MADDRPDREYVLHVLVWLALFAVSLWAATRAEGGRVAFPLIFALFALARFVAAAALFAPGPADSRQRRLVGWLVFSRTLITGALFVGLSVAALVVFPHGLGIVVGVIGLLMGQSLVVMGIQLLRRYQRTATDATAAP